MAEAGEGASNGNANHLKDGVAIEKTSRAASEKVREC